ncbi:dihydroxyacetone kinase subunit DhaK, partial [Staphylococcus haemolyticus]|uniref:dihydroxyacetone kinase subunit DhaK n=1 Tax=Staphylococcus haemolyticus TaxID=1283 RepID=UPI0016431C30
LHPLKIPNNHIQIIPQTLLLPPKKKSKPLPILSPARTPHEPAHPPYLPQRILHAPLSPQLFTSPTPHKVLQPINPLHTRHALFLILKNYPPDLINFQIPQQIPQIQ